MSAVCLFFQIHQPFRLKRYRFFDIGNDHYYFDDFGNDEIITRIAQRSYLPANELLLQMIQDSNKRFKVAFSITGTALEQFQLYVPEFIDSLKKLADTGCVEFVSETYNHSLASLINADEFKKQVEKHDKLIYELFGQKPKVFRNTELIYNDEIGATIAEMGFKGVLTEGAKHILGWKSPNYMYSAASAPKMKLLLRNSKLSDDLSLRFSDYGWHEYPLTADKYMSWIAQSPKEEQIINIAMNYEVLGESHPRETGIFDFFKALPRFAEEKGVEFWTPSEAIAKLNPVAEITVTHPISCNDEERGVSAWLGNQLQNEAFNKLYSIAERVHPVIRFGTLSLTIFVYETTVHTLFAKILHTLSGAPVPDMKNIQPDFFMTHPAVWLSYAVFMILLWAVILKFWEKIGYRFSLEWILVKATAPFRKIKSEKLLAAKPNRPRS